MIHHVVAGRPRSIVIIVLVLFSLQMLGYAAARSSTFKNSNSEIANIQATFPINGGAFDTNQNCLRNAPYNSHHSESWLTIDPRDHDHLVGVSKFFSDPEHYLFHVGASVSRDGGRSWTNRLLQGFDCRTAPRNGWSDTTDPNAAFDSNGNIYSAVLGFNLRYNSTGDQTNCCPAAEIAVTKSADGGEHWKTVNGGTPLALYPTSDVTPDKQWIAVDSNPGSPFRNNVYVGWTVIDSNGGEVWFSMSKDGGERFTDPVMITSPLIDGTFNTFILMGVGNDGTLYASYTAYPDPNSSRADVWVLTSQDGGLTFSSPVMAISFISLNTFDLPNTSFRDGIPDSFAVDPANGHLFLALEVDTGSGLDVQLTSSTDGGKSWSHPVNVNDPSTVRDGTDQFQPTVAASNDGTVAVAFYDRRLACPSTDQNILAQDRGRINFCIDTSIQFYRDQPNGLEQLGSNIRVTRNTWDPQNPGSTTHQLPRPGGPRGNETFIGDYFGLALTETTAYVLFTSNYNLGHNASNNQQQVLAIVPIPSLENLHQQSRGQHEQ